MNHCNDEITTSQYGSRLYEIGKSLEKACLQNPDHPLLGGPGDDPIIQELIDMLIWDYCQNQQSEFLVDNAWHVSWHEMCDAWLCLADMFREDQAVIKEETT